MIAALLAALLLLPLQADDQEPLVLSLEDCLRLAASRNLAIAGARLDAEATLEGFGESWGAFDTIFSSSAFWSEGTTAPTPSNFVGGVDVGGSGTTHREIWQFATGLSGQLLTGTTWSFNVLPQHVVVETEDLDPDTANSFSDLFTGDWNLDITHPLLRGGGDYARSALLLARQDAEIAALAAETVASTTLRNVTLAYWNLVFARQDRATRELSVTLATELLDITRRKFEQGLQNRIEVTTAEAELATRREELLSARTVELNAEDLLRRLVLAPQDAETWARPLQASTQPSPPQEGTLDTEQAIETAMVWRADVAEQRRRVERADVEVERARNQEDPRLDLTGGYGINANAGDASYSKMFSGLDDTNFDETHVSLIFELPLGNRTAGYALRRRQVERQRAGVALSETEMNAVGEVRTAVREVELQVLRVAVTAESVRLQNEVYEGEKRRLENDLSTPFQVRQSQRDLLTAIDNETRAKLDLEVARAALLAVQGRLLAAYGLERSMPELSLTEAPPAP